MTLYLTTTSTADEIIQANQGGHVLAIKWYPKGVTTNSEHGVTHWHNIPQDVLQAMSDLGMVLCVHGESARPGLDPFDKEKVFIEEELMPLRQAFPKLRIVMEHITTRHAVAYVEEHKEIAATITAHHLMYNRGALFEGGLRPHWYCLPLLKREEDRLSLIRAATSGNPSFFLGTDSAPHVKHQKESSCGCAGCYTMPHAMAMCAQLFDSVEALDRLEGFTSLAGADFYQQSYNKEKMEIKRETWTCQKIVSLPNGDQVIPLCEGIDFHWTTKMVF